MIGIGSKNFKDVLLGTNYDGIDPVDEHNGQNNVKRIHLYIQIDLPAHYELHESQKGLVWFLDLMSQPGSSLISSLHWSLCHSIS